MAQLITDPETLCKLIPGNSSAEQCCLDMIPLTIIAWPQNFRYSEGGRNFKNLLP